MKILYTVFFTVCVAFSGFAQDQIIMKSADELKGKVIEIKIDRIIYKDFDNLNGPTIELRKSDVFMIIYENGKIYKVEELAAAPSQVKVVSEPEPEADPRVNHIVSFFTNLPIVRSKNSQETVGVGVGFSYEYQTKGKGFGLKLSPTFSRISFDTDVWSWNVGVSPRWYLVKKAPGQFGLGLEGSVGTFFKPESSPSSYQSLLVSGHFILATHLYSRSKFNGNIEVGLGYEYWKESYSNSNTDWYGNYQSNSILEEVSQFSFFLRMSIGGRLSRK